LNERKSHITQVSFPQLKVCLNAKEKNRFGGGEGSERKRIRGKLLARIKCKTSIGGVYFTQGEHLREGILTD